MTDTLKYIGRVGQTGLYFKKFLRMFVYQSDWKVLPMGAIIAALVTLVVGSNMYVTQEGTTTGTFALACVCIWNGFFNSIQVVCRERDIIKREYRSGMYITSYIAAHMLYQLILCFLQTIVTLIISGIVGISFPAEGVITGSGLLDIGITLLIITYTADIMALMVSCIVKTTTTAMTTMPFLLIFQLIFSGGLFELGSADFIKGATISHWGINSLCAVGRFNELPMVSLWNTLVQVKDITISGTQPLKTLLVEIERNNMVGEFTQWSGAYGAQPEYEAVASNVLGCWGSMILLMAIFTVVAIIALRLVDRDKR